MGPHIKLATGPSGAPVNVTVLLLNSTNINVSWEAPLQHLQNGIIQYYTVVVLGLNDRERREIAVYEALYAIVTNLHPHYSYDVSIAAVTVHDGPFSNSTVITMPQDGMLIRQF